MISSEEKRQIEKFTKRAKRAAIEVLSRTGLASEDKEAIGYAVAEAFERELFRIINSYGVGPR